MEQCQVSILMFHGVPWFHRMVLGLGLMVQLITGVTGANNCSEYPLSLNGCKNPFESKCDPVTGKCLCAQRYDLNENGFCLPSLLTINEPCWISRQCLMTGTHCLPRKGSSITESLIEISENVWLTYINSNGSLAVIPGTCQCTIGYIFDLVEGKCVPRLIDTPCVNNYDCLRRSSSTKCYDNKCTCTARYLYDSRTDKCVFFGEVLWSRRSCFEGSCRGGGSGSVNGGPGEQYFYNHSMANIFGFSLSMTVLMMVWIVVRNCARSRLSERVVRLNELRYSDLRVAYDPFELNRPASASRVDLETRSTNRPMGRWETLPTYEEVQPPSYEEAVVKLVYTERGQPSTSSSSTK